MSRPLQEAQSLSFPMRKVWGWLAFFMALGWVLTLAWLHRERDALHATESVRLETLVRNLDAQLAQQLYEAHAALRGVQAQWDAVQGRSALLSPQLATLSRALPSIGVMVVLDEQGRVQASSQPSLLGQDLSDRPYFSIPRRAPQAGRLYLSPPFRGLVINRTVSMALPLFDAQQHWRGMVVAGLDSAIFQLILQTTLPSDDTWAVLAHEDGMLFALVPQDAQAMARNMREIPGSVLNQHLKTGEPASLLTMHSVLSRDLRLVATRTVLPQGLDLDRHMVVAVGRSIDALEAPWRRQCAAVLVMGGGLTLLASVWVWLWQRRLRQLELMRRQQRRSERDSAARMALALEGAALGLWDWDLDTQKVVYDERWCAMIGMHRDEVPPHIDSWRERVHPDDREATLARLQGYLAGSYSDYRHEYRLRHREGHWVWIHANGRVMARGAEGRPLRMIGTHLDISAARQVEAALQTQARHTQAILDNMVDGVITMGADSRILSANPAACRMFGYATEELIGANISLLMPEPDRQRHAGYVQNHLAGAQPRVIGIGRDLEGVRRGGERFPMSLAISRIETEQGPVFIGLTRDITERKKQEAAIEQLAFYDPLTGLPNRRLLLDRMHQALARRRRNGRHGGVMLIDMDNFKSINDTLGHAVGDQMLCAVAQRLSAALRSEDTVARWGGDEFVVLLQDLGTDQHSAMLHAEAAGEKLLRVLGTPYKLEERVHHSTPSIGIVLWGEGETSSEELLKAADHAMYQAKAGGRNRLCFFDPATQAAMAELTALEADLREAIGGPQLSLHLQAQVMADGRLVGAEALLRWRHPERGWISPAQFIPLAEQTGVIVQLGEWVLQEACTMLTRWAGDPRLASLALAVNLSAHQFRQKGFLGFMHQLLARSGTPAEQLKIELTESALVDDIDSVIRLMGELRSLGLKLSLDDFGTGYSSLAYLKRLPLNQLKIDQSFVRDLPGESNALAIANAVIQLGDSLGLDVIAEGVETEAQRLALIQLGCRAFQGYFFARPMPAADFEALARGWQVRTPAPAPLPAGGR